jgi:hypothetical protein
MSLAGHDIVTKARSYRGLQEQPLGSNRGPFVQKCQADTFLAGTGWPWCAAFVCHVAKECGVPLAYNGAGAHDMADHHKPWVPMGQVHPGMVVDYAIGSGHTGIVTGIDLRSATLTSIDGNWSDAVVEHVMPLSDVRAVWMIPGVQYGKVAPPTKAPTTPPAKPTVPRKRVFVIATSASGHRKILFRAAKKRRILRWLQNHAGRAALNGITITRPRV